MADRLDHYFSSDEQVRYRGLKDAVVVRWWTGGALAAGLANMFTHIEDQILADFLGLFALVVIMRVVASKVVPGMAEAAVTNRRVIHLAGGGKGFAHTEIDLKEVERVEVLGQSVRVTKTDGSIVLLPRLPDAPRFGVALAQAVGVQSPWVPGAKEKLAEGVHFFAGIVCGLLAFAFTRAALQGESLVLALPCSFGVGAMAWVLGTLAGFVLLRPFLTNSEMRAWMRQSPIFAPRLYPGARSNPFTRFCLRFVDSLYDPPAAADEKEPGPGR